MVRRTFRIVVGFVAATAAAIAFGVGWLAFEVSSGPVRLGTLTSVLAQQLSRGLHPYELQIEDAQIVWDANRREIDLTLKELVVRNAQAQTVLALPTASLGFDLTQAIAGRVAPTYLIVPNVAVRVIRDEEGRFATGLGDAMAATSETAPSEDADPLGGLLGPLGGGGVAGWLRRIDLERAVVFYEDLAAGSTLRTRAATLRLQRQVDGTINLSADMVVETTKGEVWPVSARVERAPGVENLSAEFEVTDVTLSALAEHVTELAFLKAVEMPLTGKVNVILDGKGFPVNAGVEARLGAGRLALADFYDTPLELDNARIAATVNVAEQQVDIQTLLLNRGSFRLGFRGILQNEEAGIGLKGYGGFEGLSIAALKELWPRGAAEGARQWVVQNMQQGEISGARMRLDLPPSVLAGTEPMAADAIDLKFNLEEAEAFYVRTMPPLRDGVAKAQLTGQSFTIAIESANIDVLQISEARFTVPSFSEKPTRGDVDLVLRGPVADVMWLIDHEPLGYPTKIGLAPESFTGRAAARLRLSLPLVKDLLMDDLTLGVAANVVEVDLPPLVKGFDLTGAALKLSVTGQGLRGKGSLKVNGVEVAAEWQERFADVPGATLPPSLFRGKVVTNEQERAALLQNLNVDFAPYLHGTVPLDVSIGLRQGKLDFIDVEMQLAQARLSIPELSHDFAEGAVQQGNARLRLPEQGGLQIQNLTLAGDAFAAKADLALSDKYQVSALQMRADAMPGLAENLSVDIRTHEQGSTIELSGDHLWLNGFGSSKPGEIEETEKGDGLFISPLALTADLAALTLFEKLTLNNGAGVVMIDEADLIQQVDVTASHAGSGKPFKARMVPRGESLAATREVRVLSEDAGAFMPLTGIVDEAEGGTLAAKIFLSDNEEPISGEIVVNEVRLKKAPPVVNVLNFGSFVGITDSFADRGMLLNRITAPFTFKDGEIRLRDAVAVGPSLGVHASGVVALNEDRLDLAGTITPAYSLNSALGLIPGIGEMLVGGEGQGLFAARFSVAGAFVKPQIDVNALSALTPGFLRNLFAPGKDPIKEAEAADKKDAAEKSAAPISDNDESPAPKSNE